MNVTEQVETTPPVPPRNRRRLATFAVAVAFALVVVAISLVIRWHDHPKVFYPDNSSGIGEWADVSAGHPMSFGMSWPQHRDGSSASIDWALPVVTTNTAAAQVTVRVCILATPHDVGGVGSVSDLSGTCSRLDDPAGASLRLGSFADQLVVTITPERPGVVVVRGLLVSYSHGWQHGTELVGDNIRVRA